MERRIRRGVRARRNGRNPPVFSSALDALVGILIEGRKVFPEFSVFLSHKNTWDNGSKLLSEVLESTGVKFVLMRLLWSVKGRRCRAEATYLQVAELSELLATIIESTCERLDLLMHNLVSTNIAPLSKRLAANVAAVWSLSSVSPLMCLNLLEGISTRQ